MRNQRSFKWYHPRPPTPPLPQDRVFATPTKTSIAIISGTGKGTDVKFGLYIHSPSEQKAIKNLGERRAGRIQGLPKFLKYPY